MKFLPNLIEKEDDILKKLNKRFLSLLLCVTMVASCLPLALLKAKAEPATLAMEMERVADPSTIDGWKDFFGIQTNHPNGVTLSTEFAGGVWTDKSVFLPDEIPAELTRAKYENKSFDLTDRGDNFLVALSAIASNKQIKGYSTLPTDTVLILDLSSSMRYTGERSSSAVDELVEATNKAIDSLQELNENNRVAVVVYAGTDNASWSARNGKTRVILPLDSYTTSRAGKYLESVRNTQGVADYALQVVNGVRNSQGQAAHSDTFFEVSTGTFAQDGLYMGMQELLNANPVVEEGFQAGTSRIPIMVLMTDGEPTLGNENYYGTYTTDGAGKKTFTDLGNSNMFSYEGSTADRNGVGHRDTIAFMSSLTAAFAKKQITAHYGEEGLLYTLAYGSTVSTRAEARSFLDPEDSSSVQNNLWNRFLAGETVTVYRYTSNRQTHYLTTQNSTDADLRLTAADRYYVDEAFAATNDEAMASAFDAIVDEIELQSRYYPTYVEGDHNHDGYLTFVDKIGSYMEVSDIKGLAIGNRLFSGKSLASLLNTDASGNVVLTDDQLHRFLRSICDRLGISNTTTAQTLANNAYRHGQLSYNANTGAYSNYIGWFSDASGNFVDFWHKGLAREDFPAEATHIMRSYGFLGDTADVPGIPTTDMMFMTVRIATEIATGDNTLTWKIPASLVPTVTYDVEVELDSAGTLTALKSLELADNSATDPIRLLYEVNLRRDLTEWNFPEKTGGQTTFYTNKFDATDPFSTKLNTYSHFEPSRENERYYYTSDHLVYTDANGTVYTGAQKPDGATFYHRFTVYEKLGNQLRIHYHYEPITEISLDLAEQGEGQQWYIPKDTVHRYEDDVTSLKKENPTGTMAYSDHPEVIEENGHYYTYSTQGNNGKLTVVPTTGIKLTKTLAETVPGAENRFTFVIDSNLNQREPLVIRLKEDGTEASRSALPADGKVTLSAGESVYVIGLVPGEYRITEQEHEDYTVSAVEVDDQVQQGKFAALTVVAQSIHAVEFTNVPKGTGSLVISKEVTYPATLIPTDAHNAKTFTVDVTFTGDTDGMTAPAGAVQNGNTYTVTLANNHSCTFTNVPDGVGYTVTEKDLPAGYTLSEIRYSDENKTVNTDDADQAHVINAYQPRPVSPKLQVRGTKTVTGAWPDNATFTVRLWQVYDYASGEVIKTNRTATVTKVGPDYSIDISDIDFDKAGTYYVRVAEDIPEGGERVPDMAYDRTMGLFSITVTDTNADGQLEILDGAVVGYQGTPVQGNADSGWIVIKDFNNVVTKDLVYLDIEKKIDGYVGANPPLADILFGLFPSMNANRPDYFGLTDGDGKTTLMIPVTASELGEEGKVYYLREIALDVPDRVVGMNYDESWIYAVRITWDDASNKAVVEYAPIDNGVVGTYAPYVRQDVVFTHTNIFTPGVESTPAIRLSGTKTMTGDTTELGDRRFTFSLYEADDAFRIQGEAMETVTNNGSAITFSPLTFDTPGVKHLVVKENATTLGGVTADSAEYRITILIEKYLDNGTTKLRVAPGYPEVVKYGSGTVDVDELNFTNLYEIGGEAKITIDGTKTMTGRPLLLGGFAFRLTQVTENGAPVANGLVLETENGHVGADHAAPFHFPEITYTQTGTYYYLIEELDTGAAGVTYSQAKFTVRVDVTDDGEGNLRAAKSIVSGGNSITFANSYKPSPVTTSLRSIKELNGKVLTAGQFSFTMTRTTDDFETVFPGSVPETVTNDETGLIQFPDITFDREETRYYVIREVDGGKTIDGIVYDATEYLVTVTATDNQLGSLVLVTDIRSKDTEGTTDVIAPVSSILFTNEYAVDGDASLVLEGTKTFEGGALENGKFTFQLFKTGADFAVSGDPVATATNSGAAYSIRLDYTEEDVGETYYYVLREKDFGKTLDGLTYDATQYRITVKVKDDGKGGVELEVLTDKTQSTAGTVTTVSGLNFTNEYAVDGDVSLVLEGTKTFEGGALENGKFTFQLFKTGSDFAVSGNPVATATNSGAAYSIRLDYTEEDVGETYYYVLREKDFGKTLDGLTYDATQYRITVKVKDDGKGGVELEVLTDKTQSTAGTVTTVSGLNFTNKYETEGASVVIQGKKTLTGKELKADMFTFRLFKTGADFATASLTPVEQKNNEKGEFVFELPEFTREGTYYFVVTEANGGKTVDGIAYSNATYRITVKVEDNGTGKLIPTVVCDNTAVQITTEENEATVSGVNFTNVYTPDPVVPSNGDGSHPALWIAMMLISGVLMIALPASRRRITE